MENRNYQKLEEIVSKAMHGDARAFEALCEIESSHVIYACTKLMGNSYDGEDASQEVFIYMQKQLFTLKKPEMFISWIRKIVFNVCGWMRRNKMNNPDIVPIEVFADLYIDEDSEVLPQEYLQNREKGKEVMALVDNLPDQIRITVFMHYFQDMKISEIAEMMDITEGAVKSYLYLGREKLRKALKEKDNAVYMNSAALLPMTALSSLFQREMEETITPEVVNRCLKAAGIRTSPLLRLVRLPAVKNALAAAACTTAAVISFASYSNVASPPVISAQSQGGSPQSHSAAASGPDEDTATEYGAATPEAAAPGLTPSGPGGGAPADGTLPPGASGGLDTGPAEQESPAKRPIQDPPGAPGLPAGPQPAPAPEVPPSVPAPPQAVPTRVQGTLAVKEASAAADTTSLFDKQYYATVEQDGSQLALTMVNSDGSFTFDNLAIAEAGAYTLRLRTMSNYSLAFAGKSDGGQEEIYLTPGQAYVQAAPFMVADNEAPVVAVSILDKNRKETAVNPVTIEIETYDVTKVSVAWAIQSQASGETMKRGDSSVIDSSMLNTLPKGLYTIQIRVTDAFGAATEKAGRFYTGKR